MNDDSIKYAVVNASSNNKVFAVWHDTLEPAKAEAVRLAAQNRSTFIVIQTVGYAMPVALPVQWTNCK